MTAKQFQTTNTFKALRQIASIYPNAPEAEKVLILANLKAIKRMYFRHKANAYGRLVHRFISILVKRYGGAK